MRIFRRPLIKRDSTYQFRTKSFYYKGHRVNVKYCTKDGKSLDYGPKAHIVIYIFGENKLGEFYVPLRLTNMRCFWFAVKGVMKAVKKHHSPEYVQNKLYKEIIGNID